MMQNLKILFKYVYKTEDFSFVRHHFSDLSR
jgi:hypothetical protein